MQLMPPAGLLQLLLTKQSTESVAFEEQQVANSCLHCMRLIINSSYSYVTRQWVVFAPHKSAACVGSWSVQRLLASCWSAVGADGGARCVLVLLQVMLVVKYMCWSVYCTHLFAMYHVPGPAYVHSSRMPTVSACQFGQLCCWMICSLA